MARTQRKALTIHATAWILQAAAFARLAGSDVVLDQCRDLFVQKLLAEQVEADGRFPA